jgi:hypothetical protein
MAVGRENDEDYIRRVFGMSHQSAKENQEIHQHVKAKNIDQYS